MKNNKVFIAGVSCSSEAENLIQVLLNAGFSLIQYLFSVEEFNQEWEGQNCEFSIVYDLLQAKKYDTWDQSISEAVYLAKVQNFARGYMAGRNEMLNLIVGLQQAGQSLDLVLAPLPIVPVVLN